MAEPMYIGYRHLLQSSLCGIVRSVSSGQQHSRLCTAWSGKQGGHAAVMSGAHSPEAPATAACSSCCRTLLMRAMVGRLTGRWTRLWMHSGEQNRGGTQRGMSGLV